MRLTDKILGVCVVVALFCLALWVGERVKEWVDVNLIAPMSHVTRGIK